MIGFIRLLVYALSGWIAEHGDHLELRIIPGEHHYADLATHAIEYLDDHAREAELLVEEALHDFGLA